MPSAASKPQPDQLKDAIDQASQAHHDYESNALNGVRDERWSGWYAAYILGRVGDVCTPTDLAKWLEEAPIDGDWSSNAAALVLERLNAVKP